MRIVLLLSKEFARWILISNIIAWPIALYTMNRWLQNFAYRTEIDIWPFLLAGLIILVIALLTLSYKVISVAIANPIVALRYE
jgi:putative ABC transport system permease protein